MKNHIILDEHKTVIFCIPKAANSSIKAAVLRALGYQVDADVPHRHPALNISDTAYIAENCQDYYKFVIVRNPFDRLVSCWRQKICTDRVVRQGFTKIGFLKDMHFADFVRQVAKNVNANQHFAPQYPEISHGGQILPDVIGRFENLQYWWDHMRSVCDLLLPDLPHYNPSAHRHYREYFSDETRKLAEAVYADDLKNLGYKF